MGLGGRDYTWGEGLCGWMIEGKEDDRSGGLEMQKHCGEVGGRW